jgi:hypothetical protein
MRRARGMQRVMHRPCGLALTPARPLPPRVIEPTAIELCARQVASTTGDLRLAIKACRMALEALAAARAAHFEAVADGCQEAAAGKAPPACVGPRDIMAALGRLAGASWPWERGQGSSGMQPASKTMRPCPILDALHHGPSPAPRPAPPPPGVRSSQHGAATVASIRALPNQQQLLLYSLSVLCPPPELPEAPAAASSGSFTAATPPSKARTAAGLWADATPGGGPAARLTLVRTPSGGGPGRRLFGAGGGKAGKGGKGGGDAGTVMAAGAEAVYAQYCRVCRLVGMAAATRPELRHMADLLAQMALLDVIEAPAGGACGAGTPAKAAAAALTPGGRRGRRSVPRGFGADSPALGGGSFTGGGGSEARLTLRVGHEEVQRALAANPALRCLVDDA